MVIYENVRDKVEEYVIEEQVDIDYTVEPIENVQDKCGVVKTLIIL